MDYSHTHDVDLAVADALNGEIKRQRDTLAMIASEDHVNGAVPEARGSVLTSKYVEGYPGKCYYADCEYADDVETLTVGRAEELRGAEYINVQPRSGTQANMGVYLAILDPGDKIPSLNLTYDGYLSHGHPANSMSKLYGAEQHEIDAEAGHIDYDQPAEEATAFKPDIIIFGYFVYLRAVEWETIREIVDDIDMLCLADIIYITDLAAADIHPSPIGIVDFVTGSTHKTIRADRGDIIMCNEKYASDIDSAVLPGIQDGPLMHSITGKVVGFKEALQPELEEHVQQAVDNTRALAETFEDHDLSIVSGGTGTYLTLVDLHDSCPDLTGGTAEEALGSMDIILDANTAPDEACSAFNPGGICAGISGLTTHGFGEGEVREAGGLIMKVVGASENDDALVGVSECMQKLCDANPLYGWTTLAGDHHGPTFGFSNPSPE